MSLIGKINSNYVNISNRMTNSYESKFYFRCDIYFPCNSSNIDEDETYQGMNVFGPHQLPEYSSTPDIKGYKYYIPHLLRRENVNSPEDQFDAFYADEGGMRPYIETTKKKELPYMSKVVIHIEKSKMYMFVDNISVVNGANGQMLIRMYLSPLTEG